MNLSHPINHLEELLLLYSEESNWDYEQLSKNPSISENILEMFHDKNWNYEKLSSNSAISLKFISDHPIKRVWNRWDVWEFVGNPSLDINRITDEFMSKPFLNGLFPLKQMIHNIKYRYQQYNRFFRNEVKNILKQYEQHNCIVIVSDNAFNNPHLGPLSYCLFTNAFKNQHLGPLSYCLFKLMCNIDQKLRYIPDNSEIDERFVELINPLNGKTNYYWSPCHNCISLEYVTEHDKLDYVVGNCTQLSNPSIIQSIYKMYHQIKDYYGNREMPEILKELDYEELEQMSKVGELHFLKQLSTKNRIKDILNISPYKRIYYEDNVLFTQEQFTELVCSERPLFKFTINPNFEWETIANWTWKTYDLKLLSYNSFQQHVKYRKSQLLYELESVGIFLEWNQLDDQIYDDFDAVRFLAKMEASDYSDNDRSKKIKLL